MYLPDGSYQVTGYYTQTTGSKPLTKSFTVTNGVSNPASIDLVIHPSNVTGTLKNADNSNITGYLYLQLQNSNFGSSVNVINGAFDLYLPDGTYQINGFSNNNSYNQLSGTFTVSNGALVGSINIIVPVSNVHGSVMRSDGSSPTNGSVQLQSVNMSQNKGYSANITNGAFSIYLPDGSYQVTGYYTQTTGSKPLTMSFTVTNGVSNPVSIDLVIHPSNVSGTLKNADGSNITGNLNFQLQNANFGSSVDVVNGAFDLYLPDGTYEINGLWDIGTQSYNQLSGTFAVSNVLVGSLNIIVPAKNVHGLVTRSDGAGLIDTSIQLQTIGLDQNKGYSANVTNGAFSMYLPDGSYQVTGYTNQITGQTNPIAKNFTVTNGVSNPASIDLVIPSNNVTGTLKHADSSNISANMSIQSQNGNTSTVFSVIVIEGAFDLYLPDGTYQINGYSDNTGNNFNQLSGSFTVTNGALVGTLNIIAP